MLLRRRLLPALVMLAVPVGTAWAQTTTTTPTTTSTSTSTTTIGSRCTGDLTQVIRPDGMVECRRPSGELLCLLPPGFPGTCPPELPLCLTVPPGSIPECPAATGPGGPVTSSTANCPSPCLAAPPDAFLASSAGEVPLAPGSACWTSPTPLPGAGGVRSVLCTDVGWPFADGLPSLPIRQGEALTVRFSTPASPTSFSAWWAESEVSMTLVRIELPATNPSQFRADFPLGQGVLLFGASWPQGDGGYAVKVLTTGAPATQAPLRLTG